MKQQQGKTKSKSNFLVFLLFRTSILCFVLLNGDTSASATWNGKSFLCIRFIDFIYFFFSLALNTSIANIKLFVYDTVQQTQSLYGYAQDGLSIMRSDDRGLTWSVTDLVEYSNVRIELFSSIILRKNKYVFLDDSTMYCKFKSMYNE